MFYTKNIFTGLINNQKMQSFGIIAITAFFLSSCSIPDYVPRKLYSGELRTFEQTAHIRARPRLKILSIDDVEVLDVNYNLSYEFALMPGRHIIVFTWVEAEKEFPSITWNMDLPAGKVVEIRVDNLNSVKPGTKLKPYYVFDIPTMARSSKPFKVR
jgi:hypothetical protein